MLIALCRKMDNIVISVSPIYSIIEHQRIIDELPETFKFNLVASPNIIFEKVGYYDERGILLPDSDDYKKAHKYPIMLGIINDNSANEKEFKYYEKIDTDLLTVNQVACEIISRIRRANKMV